ncbi:MAG: GPP34 family phosphoprotein, partial [Chloroflexi bacterium]|nr:GPP34 family phosphoprotein [Chloroflexota bacterium]
MENQLTLPEKLLLMAIRPEKGGISGTSSMAIDLVLTGAAIMEMLIAGNITMTDRRLEVTGENAGTSLNAYLLGKMVASQKPRKTEYWLNSFHISMKRIKGEVYQSLSQQREIRLEDRRFLFFKWQKPFLSPGNHVHQLVDRAKRLIIQPPGDPGEICFLLLLEPAQLLRRIYPERSMRKTAALKIKQFRMAETSPDMVRQAAVVIKAINMVLA